MRSKVQSRKRSFIFNSRLAMTEIPTDNIRSLLRFLSPVLAERMATYRQGTPYEDARESDIEMFVAFSRGPTTVAEIARRLSVSRQAVHMSSKRLFAKGLISFREGTNKQRDKVIVLTARGKSATEIGAAHVTKLEKEIRSIIGADALELIRGHLRQLIDELPKQKTNSSKSK